MTDLTNRLNYVLGQEGIEADPAAIAAISRMADGGYRDALTLLEQAILTTEDGRITLNQVYDQLGLVPEETIDLLLLSIRAADIPKIMETLGEIARLGRDPRAVLDSMMQRMSDLTRAAYQVPTGATDGAREASLYETAQRLGRDYLLRLRGQIAEAHKTLRDITLPRLWLEAELIRLATPSVQVVTPTVVAPTVPTPVVEPIRRRSMPGDEPRAETPTPPVATPVSPETEPVPPKAAPVDDMPAAGEESDPRWGDVLRKVPPGTPMGLKLKNSRLVETNEDVWKVALTRMVDVDWFTDDAKRQRHINKLTSDSAGRPIRVIFMAQPKGLTVSADDGAVELPVEGDKLEQLAREIFDVPRSDPGHEAS
ncbi:hypothetical protein EON79_16800 [bacterium]|nr:MAG: hypothetical protein EON79_16800 [bacterium]